MLMNLKQNKQTFVLAIVEWRSCGFKESPFEKTGRWDTKHCSEVFNVYFIS